MVYLQIHDLLCEIFFKETDCALGYYFLELLGIEDQILLCERIRIYGSQVMLQ
jgi:hypothetical protein